MKAMTCPQCGALIKKISLKDKFAECEYCEARILLEENRDRIVDIPDKPAVPPPSPWEEYRANHQKVDERTPRFNSFDYNAEPKNSSAGVVVIIGLIALVAGIIVFATFRNSSPPPAANTARTTALKATPTPAVVSWYPTPTPAPQVNYQVKVQWSGANDMEQFENPQIDVSKLPSSDEAELKKTVFKNRAVQVKITIGTDGEVTSAEAVSGHPILAEAAVEAAKKTLFNSRSKPTTRVLTYYFRLLSD